MPARRLLVAFAVAALSVAGLVPAVLADGPDATGTLAMPDGSPAAGFEVSLSVVGSDMAWSATTDEQGAWSASTGVLAGQVLSVRVVTMTYASPDASGCVTSSGLAASADVTVSEVPVPPIHLVLAAQPEGKVCSATATPRNGPTPPATDAGMPPSAGGTGVGALLGGLAAVALVAIGLALVGPARRSGARQGR